MEECKEIRYNLLSHLDNPGFGFCAPFAKEVRLNYLKSLREHSFRVQKYERLTKENIQLRHPRFRVNTNVICKRIADDMRFLKDQVNRIDGLSQKSRNIIVNEWTKEVK